MIEAHGDGAVAEVVEVGADFGGVDEVGVFEHQVVVFSVNEQSQEDQLEEVVEPAGVLGDEGDVL